MIITYKEYEKEVFDWLTAKNKNDPTFTFSLRKKGSKGSELDYFIGTETSKYFGITFWTIPISYPGSSTDFINLFFKYSKNEKSVYYFQLYQTRNPVGEQNVAALKVAKDLKVRLKVEFPKLQENQGEYELFTIPSKKPEYQDLKSLFSDLEEDLSIFIPIVDEEVAKMKSIDPSFVGHRITPDEFNSFKEKMNRRIEKYGNPLTPIFKIENPKNIISNSTMTNYTQHPLNQILYGPPGTGKTYNTINYAVAIIENTDVDTIKEEEREDVLSRFEAYKHNGLIKFVTFHQSFSYEDFVEGIKPETIGEENERKIIYEIEDGVFKSIANDANSVKKLVQSSERNNLYINDSILNKVDFFKMSLGATSDDQIYDYCKENDVIALGWGDDINFENVRTEEEVKELLLSNDYKSTDYAIIAIKCLKFWMKKGDIIFIANGNSRVKAIAQIVGNYSFNDSTEIGYNHFRDVKWLATDLDIPVEMVYEKKFSQQSIYAMYNSKIKKAFFQQNSEENQKAEPDNYVLIIDEINRGNVSQIFGELITLLEEDKRSDAENGMPLSVTLPYSKTSFSVPKNLYVVGTMNTADRSVESLDTALRRRFSFQEIFPCYNLEELDYEIIPNLTANDLLKTINNRIERLLDKDHLIGHSFFIKNNPIDALDKVRDTFYKNIIPLLQEYFYGDYGKIGLILGKGFVEKKMDNSTSFAEFDYDIETKDIYEIIDYRNSDRPFFVKAINTLMNRKNEA